MATHSSTLAWKIPWIEEPGRLHGVAESDTTQRLHFLFLKPSKLQRQEAGLTALSFLHRALLPFQTRGGFVVWGRWMC